MQVCFLASATRLVSRTSTSVQQFTRSQQFKNEETPNSETDTNPQNRHKMQAVRCGDWQDLGTLRQPHLSLHVTTPLSAQNKAAFYPPSEAGLICATNAGFQTSRNELRQQSDTPASPHPPSADSVTVLGTVSSPGASSVFLFENKDDVHERKQQSFFFFSPPWMYGCSARSVGRERWQEQENGSDPNPREIVNTRWRGTANTWQQQGPARVERGGHKAPSGKCM